MAIIIVLAGLIIGTSGYVQKKGARSRAEAEIAAMSAALESYKADNGIYPRLSNVTEPSSATGTEGLNARQHADPEAAVYTNASRFLYAELSGDRDFDRQADSNSRSYFSFKPQMLAPPSGAANVTAVRDPFGNSYGYSTANQVNTALGYNPTFDLWSTAGVESGTSLSIAQQQWIKNW
jgi:type II secretory pathway pseudopilin PulG